MARKPAEPDFRYERIEGGVVVEIHSDEPTVKPGEVWRKVETAPETPIPAAVGSTPIPGELPGRFESPTGGYETEPMTPVTQPSPEALEAAVPEAAKVETVPPAHIVVETPTASDVPGNPVAGGTAQPTPVSETIVKGQHAEAAAEKHK